MSQWVTLGLGAWVTCSIPAQLSGQSHLALAAANEGWPQC